MKYRFYHVVVLLGMLVSYLPAATQGLLGKTITLEVSQQRLDNVLEIVSNKGDFYFSYNSTIVRKDSLVSFSARNKTVREILSLLFPQNFEFRESGNYIIIRRAPIKLVMVTNKGVLEERIYLVSGYVYDEHSGHGINEASVYEKRLLASALTNHEGYFKLKLKSGKASTAALTISKEFYEDTTVLIQPRHSQELAITLVPFEQAGETIVISPEDYLVQDTVAPVNESVPLPAFTSAENLDSSKVERTRMGRFLLSGKQRVQSLNLKKFFTTRPFQFSLIPGLSSHGKLSGQVVNNFSLNAFGGYTAGTNGIEIGGLFNIDKKTVRYLQVGGLFNVVGGAVNGVQIAGLNNTVLDTVSGLQVAGLNNVVRGKFRGWQLAGLYNHVTDSFKGVQVGGLANFTRKKMSGVQLAGLVNFSNKETDGVQIAGIINYSKKLKGVQVGLINISDSSDGYSIGLINIVLKGYHKLTLSTDEITQVNVAFKTGSRRLYNILQAGMNPGVTNKVYSFGYGLGTEFTLNKRKNLLLNPELTSNFLYLGSWNYTSLQNKLQLSLGYRLNKFISIFAAPSFSIFVSDQHAKIPGYRYPVPAHGYGKFNINNRTNGWLGWSAGLSFF